MNFSQFLLIVRARLKVILLVLCVTVCTTLAVSLLLPKSYKATTSLVLNYKGVDPVTGMTLPAQLMPGFMATQVDIIGSKSVALKVIDDLKLANGGAIQQQYMDDTEGKGTIRDWLAALLLKNLTVEPGRESSVIAITFKGADPTFAAAVADAFAKAYQRTSIQLKVEPAQQASGYFSSQIKALRDKLESAQNKLTKYQQEKGIVNAENQFDVESARLNDLSSQLVAAQGQAMEANSRQRQALGNAGESPDVLLSPLIQSLKSNLSAAEAKFAEMSQRMDTNHPQYQAAKMEIAKVRADLDEQIRIASSGVANNARILQQREAEVRAALAAQKAKVIMLNGARDELKLLTNEMESAKRAYEGATLRFTQTDLEGQSNQSDIAVLNPAEVPIEASSPKVLLNTLASVFLGAMLGLGFALFAEMIDRRVRCGDDLVDGLKAPLLGLMQWDEAPRRRAFFNRRQLPA